MKTKKFVSALLALVMVLSIAPMAAFAAEEDHSHDETCGCVSTLAVCSHSAISIAYTQNQYAKFTNLTHKKTPVHYYYCDLCGAFIKKADGTVVTEAHYKARISYTTDTDSGDEYRFYTYTCVCNYEWYEIIYEYEGYPD